MGFEFILQTFERQKIAATSERAGTVMATHVYVKIKYTTLEEAETIGFFATCH
jgi:hypothetical protein